MVANEMNLATAFLSALFWTAVKIGAIIVGGLGLLGLLAWLTYKVITGGL